MAEVDVNVLNNRIVSLVDNQSQAKERIRQAMHALQNSTQGPEQTMAEVARQLQGVLDSMPDESAMQRHPPTLTEPLPPAELPEGQDESNRP